MWRCRFRERARDERRHGDRVGQLGARDPAGKAASGDVDAPDDLDRLKLPEEMFEVAPHDPFVPSIGTRAAVPPNR